MNVIAVANQKGGVGKTTTAVNLSTSLAYMGQKVLLVDCDPQGNASSGLGARLTPDAPSFHTFLADESAPPPYHTPLPAPLDLTLIPSCARLAAIEWNLASQDQAETLLVRKLSRMDLPFTHIILDCPPSLGLLTVNVLSAAQSVIIPLQCEYYALEGLTLLLETIRKVRMRFNSRLSIEGILITMFDRRNNLAHQVVNEVQKHVRFRTFDTFIPRNVRLSESPSHGLPVLLYDPGCPGSKAYLSLASEILKNGGS